MFACLRVPPFRPLWFTFCVLVGLCLVVSHGPSSASSVRQSGFARLSSEVKVDSYGISICTVLHEYSQGSIPKGSHLCHLLKCLSVTGIKVKTSWLSFQISWLLDLQWFKGGLPTIMVGKPAIISDITFVPWSTATLKRNCWSLYSLFILVAKAFTVNMLIRFFMNV